jgi:hypothetical protein
MKWLEVITLQVAGKSREAVQRKITGLIDEMGSNGGIEEVSLYRHAMTGNSLSVHLHWDSAKVDPSGSAAGLSLCNALAEYGLISHAVWIEGQEP